MQTVHINNRPISTAGACWLCNQRMLSIMPKFGSLSLPLARCNIKNNLQLASQGSRGQYVCALAISTESCNMLIMPKKIITFDFPTIYREGVAGCWLCAYIDSLLLYIHYATYDISLPNTIYKHTVLTSNARQNITKATTTTKCLRLFSVCVRLIKSSVDKMLLKHARAPPTILPKHTHTHTYRAGIKFRLQNETIYCINQM